MQFEFAEGFSHSVMDDDCPNYGRNHKHSGQTSQQYLTCCEANLPCFSCRVFGQSPIWLGQKGPEQKAPELFNFQPEFPKMLRMFPEFSRTFRTLFPGKWRPLEDSANIPAIFQCQIPRRIKSIISQLFSGVQAK